MKTQNATLIAVLLTVALTGCSSMQGFFGRGAPCGPACLPSAAPAYDVGPGYGGECCDGDYDGGYSVGGGCNCEATDGYAYSNPGVIHDGLHGGAVLSGPDYGGPYAGQIMPDGSTVVGGQQGSGTSMAPVPALPNPPAN